MTRIIAHLDMDAFFASIEEADSPIFAGKPIVVGADPHSSTGLGRGRGVVSTANYKAREYGIHSALPISIAWQLSQEAKAQGKPEVVFVTPNFERYQEVSVGILEIIKKYLPAQAGTQVVEPASIDEFYFDLSDAKCRALTTQWQKAKKICLAIKKDIKTKYKITCSIGLAPNKLVAKIAAGTKKPDGLVIVRQGEEGSFLEPMSIREIPGVGPKTEEKLNKANIFTVKDAKIFSQQRLQAMLGKFGNDLYNKIRGIDDSFLEERREAKSIGEQITFEQDTLNAIYIGDAFEKLCNDVFLRFKNSGFKNFKSVGIIVRFAGFQTHTSIKTLGSCTNSDKILKLEALKLLLPYLDRRKNPSKKLIRLIGVKIEKLK